MASTPAGGVTVEQQRSERTADPGEGQAPRLDQYLQAIFTYVCQRVPDRTEAEDTTAEVFAAAVAARPKFRGEGGTYAWLIGIARRKIVDSEHRRRTRRELRDVELNDEEREALGALLAAEIGPLPEEVVQHREACEVMRKLLADLPELQREALLLQVVHEFSIREIARVIGRSEAATNSLLQRARAAIFRHGRSYFLG